MKKVKREESKIKPDIKLLDTPFDLRTLDTNVIVDFLEDQIKLREDKVEEHVKKQLRK